MRFCKIVTGTYNVQGNYKIVFKTNLNGEYRTMYDTNHLPKVGANDDGIWRRLVVIPFNAHIVGDTDIKNYADYLFEC